MLNLTPAERRALRARAHHLQPVVMIGDAGLTPAVSREIDAILKSHELIKIRVLGDDRGARESLINTVCNQLDAAPVQHIGKILVVYRPRPDDETAPRSSRRKDNAKAGAKPARSRSEPRRTKRSYQGS